MKPHRKTFQKKLLALLLCLSFNGATANPGNSSSVLTVLDEDGNGDGCNDLVGMGTGGISITIGKVCATVEGDFIKVEINVTESGCCLKETHICNVPGPFVAFDSEACEKTKVYDLEVSEYYGFMCTEEGEMHQIDGHASIVCNSGGPDPDPPAGGLEEYKECHVYPDPHFKMWDGQYFDYHGGCDLVLIANEAASNPIGHMLTIRTELMGTWSGISNAALRIGGASGEIFEMAGDGTYYINKTIVPTPPTLVGGAPLICTTTLYSTTCEFDLGSSQYVRFTKWNNHISVFVFANKATFENSTGLCGTWIKPGLKKRDRSEAMAAMYFAQDWTVNSALGEHILHFDTAKVKCETALPPDKPDPDGQDPTRRKLREESTGLQRKLEIAPEQAEEECKAQGLSGQPLQNCIFDILQTDDLTWALSPAYAQEVCVQAMYWVTLKCGMVDM